MYVVCADFPAHVAWDKSGNQNDLVQAPTSDNGMPAVRATCAVVGTISLDRLYLEPHGNYNPNFERAALESSKLQFRIVAPASHPDLKNDFDIGINHIDQVEARAITQGPKGEHFKVKDRPGWLSEGIEVSLATFQEASELCCATILTL
jgi:hypothetical protein